MPHAPILVPEVGGRRNSECLASVEAIHRAAEATRPFTPSFLFVLNPHSPFAGGCTMLFAGQYSGSLADFGAGSVRVEAPGAGEEGRRLAGSLASEFPVEWIERGSVTLDYGAVVPLSFLGKAWGGMPLMLLANPMGLGYEEAWNFGRALSGFQSPSPWALVASGDLSHRLSQGAPGGFHPDGRKLDRALCEALESGSPKPVFDLGERVISNAGECGLRSALILLGLANGREIKLFSYEGPFGVGYGVALWLNTQQERRGGVHEEREKPAERGIKTARGNPYAALARHVLEEYLETGEMPDASLLPGADEAAFREKKACFVSLKTLDGTLRGCIGTIEPACGDLAHEIAENARAAATRDPRFPHVTREELDRLVLSVDVLSTPEPVTSLRELDPGRYGVIVSKGRLRGVLLPDLPGISTVDEQLDVAMHKAGITNPEHVQVSRFTVSRYDEKQGD